MEIAMLICALIGGLYWWWRSVHRWTHPLGHTVIVTRNAAAYIEQFFFEQDWAGWAYIGDDELIVLDIGSTDDTVRISERWLRYRGPSAHIVIAHDWQEALDWLARHQGQMRLLDPAMCRKNDKR